MKKKKDVSKFGGREKLGTVKLEGDTHDVESAEVLSQTKLEDDEGYGNATVIRCFEFAANPESFQYKPTKQDLFNHHAKGIEISLWKDGLQVIPEIHPRIHFDDKAMRYKIFIVAKAARGHLLHQTPQTLTKILHGTTD